MRNRYQSAEILQITHDNLLKAIQTIAEIEREREWLSAFSLLFAQFIHSVAYISSNQRYRTKARVQFDSTNERFCDANIQNKWQQKNEEKKRKRAKAIDMREWRRAREMEIKHANGNANTKLNIYGC